MKLKRSLIKNTARYVFWFAAVFTLASLFSFSSIGKNIDNFFLDPLQTDVPRKEVVIVGIDDKSLQKIGPWPWNRSVFAQLHSALSDYGVRAIGYDVLFLEPRDGDAQFFSVLTERSTPTVLGSKLEGEKYLDSFLKTKNTYAGVVNVDPDMDGKVRTATLYRRVSDTCVPSFAQKLFQLYTNNLISPCNTDAKHFRYQSEPLLLVSAIDVIERKVPQDTLKNSIALIGSATLDLEDHFVGITGEKVPGVMVHGQILTTILNDSFNAPLTFFPALALFLVLALIAGGIGFFSPTLRVQIILFVAFLALLTLVGFVAFDYHILLPYFGVLLVPLSIYAFTVLYRYVEGKKESAYVRTLFSRYVHPDLLKELIDDPKKLNLGGEKKRLTILFSDLRGFTTISESLTPEGLVDLLNDYLDAMAPPILNTRGTIDKYIGDAIMAFWNAPLETKDHELQAVLAGLAMQDILKKFNQSRGTNLAIGIGINTGDVVVGNMGSKERINYTVMGDAVNAASRFEGLTKKYGITTLVSEAVKEKAVKDGLMYRKLDVMLVKGKHEPLTVYEPMEDTKENRAIATTYEEAFALYQKADFENAKIKLRTIGEDGAAKALLARIEGMSDELKANWKGIWKWEEK